MENIHNDGKELAQLAIVRCIDDAINPTLLRCHCLSKISCVVAAVVA